MLRRAPALGARAFRYVRDSMRPLMTPSSDCRATGQASRCPPKFPPRAAKAKASRADVHAKQRCILGNVEKHKQIGRVRAARFFQRALYVLPHLGNIIEVL